VSPAAVFTVKFVRLEGFDRACSCPVQDPVIFSADNISLPKLRFIAVPATD